MKSGMLAAESIFAALEAGREGDEVADYPAAFEKSWLHDELHRARNFKPLMSRGLYAGSILFGIDQVLLRGKAPWTLSHPCADHESLRKKGDARPIAYPKADGTLTFDRLSSVFISNTNHEEDQPVHLTLADPSKAIDVNLALYDAPETRYCPRVSTKS
jgi:electron-transferring-flavoprotein dehydrogenase